MNLSNLRVAPKLWGTILGLLVIMLLSNLWMTKNMESVLEASQNDVQQLERKIAHVQYVRGTALAASEIGIAQFGSSEPRVQAELRKRLDANVKVTVAAFKELDASLTTEGERAQFDKIAKIRLDLRDLRAKAEKNLDLDDFNARTDFAFGPYAQGADAYYAAFDGLIEYQRSRLEGIKQKAEAMRAQSTMIGWSVAMVLLLFGVLLARWLVKDITAPLLRSVQVAESIGNGDLTASTHTPRGDELGQLLNALNSMATKLRTVIGDVRQGVDSVSSAAGQIASGNQDLSARTEQTAANLQQTAASVEEMSASVNQAADTSRQANQLATTAVQAAERGGEVVQQVVQSMAQINTSSRKINDIIGVIDGIAFQTNILALNAAVEAARAGEQGRGFAVVAGEVRSLAQRSAEAAKEIKVLIEASVRSVDVGAVQVQQAGTSMEEIVASVRRVTDLIGEITASSSEQREGFGQVNTAVSNLDQMTQQNAALVEESSAAAAAMNEQAQMLMRSVSVFKIDGHQAFAPMAPRVQPVPAKAAPAPMRAPAPVAKPATPKPAPRLAKAAPAPAAKPAADDDWETF